MSLQTLNRCLENKKASPIHEELAEDLFLSPDPTAQELELIETQRVETKSDMSVSEASSSEDGSSESEPEYLSDDPDDEGSEVYDSDEQSGDEEACSAYTETDGFGDSESVRFFSCVSYVYYKIRCVFLKCKKCYFILNFCSTITLLLTHDRKNLSRKMIKIVFLKVKMTCCLILNFVLLLTCCRTETALGGEWLRGRRKQPPITTKTIC